MIQTIENNMDLPAYVWGLMAGVFATTMAVFGLTWFRDLSARVRHLEEITIQQQVTIGQQSTLIQALTTSRDKLRSRMQKHGLEEESV
jgi:DNA-binding NtrC family response regulator